MVILKSLYVKSLARELEDNWSEVWKIINIFFSDNKITDDFKPIREDVLQNCSKISLMTSIPFQ